MYSPFALAAIEVRDLVKTYRGVLGRDKVQALRGVSLTIEEGEIYGLLGPNGAGKTTLIKCLLGLVRPDSGEAKILGRPGCDPEARRNVGYLPEEHAFPTHRRALPVLRFFGALYGFSRGEGRRRAEEVLKAFGLWDKRRAKLKGYSKGMRQRLALAQALMPQPKVLILDEPTANLDPLARKDVKDLFLRLKGEGVAILISSHVLTEIERICDRVGVLHQGLLLQEGTVEALTAEKSLEDVFVSLVRASAEETGLPEEPPGKAPKGG